MPSLAVPDAQQSDGPDQRSLDTQDLTNKDRASPETVRRDAADHETGDRELSPGEPPGADAEDSPARVIGPTSPDATRPDSRSWWEALPHLKEQWERHQERWPQDQRPSVERTNDEPGSWRGDSGRALTARDNAHVDARCDQIAKAEEHITSRVEEIERSLPQAILPGRSIGSRNEDRLKDKVATHYATNADVRCRS